MIYSTFALVAVTYGSGRHIYDIPTADIPVGLKVFLFLFVYLVVNVTCH